MPISVSVDLRHLFGLARDQGPRPTCMGFAGSDTHAALRRGWEPLSCEYLFFRAQTRAGRPPTVGASLDATLDALRHDGQPEETDWPYLPLPPIDPATWHPPTHVRSLYRCNGKLANYDIAPLLAVLDQGVPVILLIYLSSSFYMPISDALVVPAADELPDPNIRHAVIAVGHGDWNGERVVLIRNSWGPIWGEEGYAWLTESFIVPRLFGAAILMENIDVSVDSVAT